MRRPVRIDFLLCDGERELEPWTLLKFSLDAFLADGIDQFGDGREIHLRARIGAALAKRLSDSPLSADMRSSGNSGRWVLTATVRDTWSLHTWILGHADGLCVEQPASLRQSLAERLKSAAAQYESN